MYRLAGDYRGAGRRAGGLFSFLGNAVHAVTGVVSHLGIPGISQVAGVVSGVTGRSTPTAAGVASFAGPSLATVRSSGGGRGRRPEPGITGAVHRLVPGGHTGYIGGRHMNTMNPKALSRATRRIKGFEKKAKHALSALGLHVVRHKGCAHGRKGARR